MVLVRAARASVRALWILAVFVLLFALGRAVLALSNREVFGALTGAELARAWLDGVRYDALVLAWFVGPVLLALTLPFAWAGARAWRRAWSRVALALFLAAAALIVIDTAAWPGNAWHLTRALLDGGHDLDMLVAVTLREHALALALFVGVALACLATWRRLEAWDERVAAGARPPGWCAPLVAALALAAARGGFGAPLGLLDAYRSDSWAHGQLALNAPYTLLRSYVDGVRRPAHPLSSEEALASVRSELLDPAELQRDPAEYPLERSRRARSDARANVAHPNVIVLMLESWDARFVDCLRRAHGLESLGATPHFDELARGGLLFTNFHATGSISMNGLTAVLAGVPTLPGLPTLGRGLERSGLACLGSLARAQGYSTHFVQGAKRASFHVERIAALAGFERFLGCEDVVAATGHAPMPDWGAWDADLFDVFGRTNAAARGPFLGLAFTTTTHEPFHVPADFAPRFAAPLENAAYLNALAYADECLGRFMASARAAGYAEHTLFALVADHPARLRHASDELGRRFEIPCLLVGPGVAPGTSDAIASQTDLLPTLASLAGWEGEYAALGRSLVDGPLPPERGVLCSKGDLVLRIERDGWIAHDLERAHESRANAPGFDRAGAERRLVAAVQTQEDLLARDRWFAGTGGSVAGASVPGASVADASARARAARFAEEHKKSLLASFGLALGLLAALAFQLGLALQKQAALLRPRLERPSALGALAFLTSARGLGSSALLAAGWLLQLGALSLAPIGIVMPAVAVGVAFQAVIARRFFGERLHPGLLAGLIACATGIVLLALSLGAGEDSGHDVEWGRLFALVAGLGGVALALGPAARHRGDAANAWALSAGLFFASSGVLAKALAVCVRHGRSALVCAGPLALLVLFAVAGFARLQAAHQRGKALVVIPLTCVLADFVPASLGPLLFGEPWPAGGARLVRLAAFVAIVAGLLLLTRPVAGVQEDGARRTGEVPVP